MSVPQIPRGLKPLIEGYSIGAPGGVRATELAGGAPRFGLEWEHGPQQFRVSMNMRPDKFSVWTAFFHHVIKKGAITFSMPIDSGFGLQDHDCNILPGSYSASRINGQITRVSFAVSAESRVYDMTPEEAHALIDLWNLYGNRLGPLIDRLAIFANHDTNAWDF